MVNKGERNMVKVLLVVSDRIEMTLMRFALESNGCEVEVATNGFSALKKLDAESAQGRKEMKYDLLVTSEKLPVMTGADLCREVKKIK
ncbi:response regulator, partial [bacterium]|nr:response regulator [bacterium]